MRKKDQMYQVELKSKSILREGKKSLITYFQGGNRKTIAMNVMRLYPQYTKPEDMPKVIITAIPYREYLKILNGGVVTQKSVMVNEVRQ